MRLYPLTAADAVTDPAGGVRYEPGPDGGFDFPEHFGRAQHSFCVAGRRLWETDAERRARLAGEEAERRKDPASLLDAVERIVRAAEASGAAKAEPAKAPVKAAPAKPPAAK